jgi:hypothetical protein
MIKLRFVFLCVLVTNICLIRFEYYKGIIKPINNFINFFLDSKPIICAYTTTKTVQQYENEELTKGNYQQHSIVQTVRLMKKFYTSEFENTIEVDTKIKLIRNSTKKLKLLYRFLLSKHNHVEDKKHQYYDKQLAFKLVSPILLLTFFYNLSLLRRLYSTISQSIKRTISSLFASTLPQQQTTDLDVELETGISNLIEYINGLTSIWLQSTSKADKLVLDLPTLFYCECIDLEGENENFDYHYNLVDLAKKKFRCCNCGKNNKSLLISDSAIQQIKLNECSVCLDSFKQSNLILQLPCRHNFHKKCIYEWFLTGNYQCPICRTLVCKFNLKNLL